MQHRMKLGQTQSYVSKCETLYRRVDMLELLRFLRLYGVPARDFFRPWTPAERRTLSAYHHRSARTGQE